MARRSSGKEEEDRSSAGETKPIKPEDQGVERPIWKEPRPEERRSMPDTDPAGIIIPDFKEGADDAQTDRVTDAATSDQDKDSPEGPQSDSKPTLPNEDDPDPVDAPGGDVDRAGFDVGPVNREGADIIDPVHTEGGDEGDPAAVIWPQYDEGTESIDAETEDADWDDDAPEMEVDVDIDEDVDTHVDVDEDVDTYEDVDVDIDVDDEDEEDIES